MTRFVFWVIIVLCLGTETVTPFNPPPESKVTAPTPPTNARTPLPREEFRRKYVKVDQAEPTQQKVAQVHVEAPDSYLPPWMRQNVQVASAEGETSAVDLPTRNPRVHKTNSDTKQRTGVTHWPKRITESPPKPAVIRRSHKQRPGGFEKQLADLGWPST